MKTSYGTIHQVIAKTQRRGERLFGNVRFQAQALAMRNRWNVPDAGLRDRQAGNQWYATNELNLDGFYDDIIELMREHRLAPHWFDTVKFYVLYGVQKFWIPTVTSQVDDRTGLPKLSMPITENMTLKDAEAIWPVVRGSQEKLPYRAHQKLQPRPEADRDERAYQLQMGGRSLKEIAEELSTERKTYMDYDVAKFIERYKRKAGIN